MASAGVMIRGRFSPGRTRFEHGDEMPVLDIVAERFKLDLGRVEKNLRRAEQTLGVVDDAQFA